jgi:hypothetical protein
MLRSDRTALWSGEKHRLEVWLANDTATAPTGWHLRYTVESEGRILSSGHSPAKAKSCAPVFQGYLGWQAPQVAARTEFTLRIGLFDADDRIVNDSATTFIVWPRRPAAPIRLSLAGTGGAAERLARELSAGQASDAPLVLADRLPATAPECETLWRRVAEGATLVLTELPAGRHRIGRDMIEVKPCGFAPYDFVSRATGHPLVAGFMTEDFRFWHDPAGDMISPLLSATFQAGGWTPILVSGEAGWGTPAVPALAAAERMFGRGRIIISLLALAGRTETNPAADVFARRLLLQ